jgi:carbamate kinase
MLIVVALGGNALLKRGEPLTVQTQRDNVKIAARALAPLGRAHQLVITHGNGPQVGMLALEAAAYTSVGPYTLDILGAESEGMIGYMIEQELGNVLPEEKPFATILSQVEVDPDDPAFLHPSKPIGPLYTREEAEVLAREHGWTIGPDGDKFRRLVPSPLPKRIFEIRVIEHLVKRGVVVICAGGGGIPTILLPDGNLVGVDAVVDKDRAGELLATSLAADFYLMLTDARAVYYRWGQPGARAIKCASPAHLRELSFAEGSMRPKVEAACGFVETSGKKAGIGALEDAATILTGDAGTIVAADCAELEWWPE